MDILVIHPSLNAGGGSERLCLTIIECLKEKGYNITLGTFEKTDWEEVKKLFGKVVRPDAEIVKSRFFGYSAYGELLNFHRLLSSIHKNYETVIVSCTSPWFYCPTAKKTIIYMIPPVSHRNGPRRAYLIPYVFIQSMFLKKAKNKVILTNSSFSSKIIKDVYSLKSRVLYPPVNIEDFHSSSKKEELVVSVGRFDSFKRFEFLIRAFARVENGRCIIMGSAHNFASLRYLKELRRLINNLGLNSRVELIINCSRDMLRDVLSEAKVYVHCALFEHFGISVVEAMASGCVPIVHKSGGPYSDIVEYGKFGFAFENIEELADNINMLLQDYNLFRTFSQKAMQRSKLFNKERFKKEFLKFVHSLCSLN